MGKTSDDLAEIIRFTHEELPAKMKECRRKLEAVRRSAETEGDMASLEQAAAGLVAIDKVLVALGGELSGG
jgi:hypothetical protein